MIIFKLIHHRLKHGNDDEFYRIQARDSIKWMRKHGVDFREGLLVLDLGCGHGIFGNELGNIGCEVVMADVNNWLCPDALAYRFIEVDVNVDDLSKLGQFDLVICSNMFEHIENTDKFLGNIKNIIKPGGMIYFSWTNWLSPFGGHEISPFHYLGPKLGTIVRDKIFSKKRLHTPYVNLFPTYIGTTLKDILTVSGLETIKTSPRYYSELSFIMRLPFIREFLAWNCAVLARRPSA